MINWSKLETEYITGNISQIELSNKYKISRSTIQDRCKKGTWTAKRAEYRAKLAQNSVQKAAERNAEFYADLIRVCDEASMALAERIRDMAINQEKLRSSDMANLTAALERIKGFLPDDPAGNQEGGGIVMMPDQTDGD